MADIKSPEERSRNMAKIRSRDTKPEDYVRKLLFGQGYRYRKNVSGIPGHPDAWLPKYNTALFVHGCFWHRHTECRYAYTPKSRVDFWTDKFRKNIARDAAVREQLAAGRIRVLVIWECTVNRMMRSEEERERVLGRIVKFLTSDGEAFEL